jgi:S-formylglutathione hydrolase FrmB
MMRMIRRGGRLLVVAALAAACLQVAVPGPSRAAEPLTLLSQTTVTLPVNNRPAVDYRFQTSALPAPTTVRVMFPRNYDPSGATRYPVLYLLHGGAANYTSWTAQGGIAQVLTDGLDLITVMPDGGASAWYTDWYNNGRGGTPKWETFHIDQLIPWIDANLPTVGTRAGRAIAGLSSGGFGTMSYASRHPDLFVAAAAFSGATDTNTPPVMAGKVIDGLAAQDGGVPGSLFGLRETEEVRWRGHNPWDLAENLRGMDLTLRWGNAFPGGGGTEPPWDFGGRFLERATYQMNVSFDRHLRELGIDHVAENYGPGSHNFYYWNRDLERTLPSFMAAFAEHRPDPSPFSYRSIEPSYSVYGWTVAMARPVVEFSSLQDVTATGFTVTGSGAAGVTTPPAYGAGRRYAVCIASGTGQTTEELTADGTGRLHIDVPLGPANPAQQYFVLNPNPATVLDPMGSVVYAGAISPATTVYSTAVTITAINDTPPAAPSRITFEAERQRAATIEISTTLANAGSGAGIAGRDVLVFVDGVLLQALHTGADGTATGPVQVEDSGGKTFRVEYAGDDAYEPSAAQAVMNGHTAAGSS